MEGKRAMADHRDAATGPLGRLALARGTVDRTAELRLDELALAAAWSNPDTRVLVVSEGRAFVLDGPDPVVPDAARLTPQVALYHCHRSPRDCSGCGEPTQVAAAGHIRRCAGCGTEHYPRT